MRRLSILHFTILFAASLALFGVFSPAYAARQGIEVQEQDVFTTTVVIGKSRKSRVIACYQGDAGELRSRGDTLFFLSFQKKLRILKRKSAPQKRRRKVRKFLRAGKPLCESNTSLFLENGDTTEYGRVVLKIPEGLIGNQQRGEEVYQQNCLTCHEERRNRNFVLLRTILAREPMLYDETLMPDAKLADLTSYLNRLRK